MKNNFSAYLTLFIWLISGIFSCLQAEPEANGFNKTNIAYYYNPESEIKLDHHLAVWENQARLLLRITTKRGITLKENYQLIYQTYSGYDANNPIFSDSIDYERALIQRNGYDYYFSQDINLSPDVNLIVLNIKNLNTDSEYLFDISIDPELNFSRTDLIIEKENQTPLLNNYINAGENLKLHALSNQQGNVFAYYYSANFRPAEPPMAELSSNIQEKINIDSLIQISLDENIRLEKQGLYFMQKDTNSLEGIALRSENVFYPRLAKIDHVIDPLIYITTKSERQKLLAAKDKKKELDRFWLNIAKNSSRAKTIIKEYYQRIEEANQFFTSYKEGWKTDQGMIYALYGTPDEVYRSQDREEWIYKKTDDLSKVSFTFIKVKNIFSNNHYTLIRDQDYEKYWFRIVDLWRKGRQLADVY
ncbi:MAG: GWxTD domain-containing protein [Candidatus Cyclobacteriaceae bacterium M3_2C_046]